MVDGHQLLRSGNVHSSFLFYGCQSFWMGSSSQADETILSWSLVRRLIPALYQYSGNDGHLFSTEESHKIHTPLLGYDSTGNTTVIYINKQGGIHSTNLYIEILHWCLEHDIVRFHQIPGKFNIMADRFSRLDRPLKTEWALDQSVVNYIFQMLNYPNVDLFATRFNHKLPLYVSPVLDNHALVIDALSMNWNFLHAYAFPPTILIPSVLAKIRQSRCRIVLIAPLWPQRSCFSEMLQLLVSAPIRLPLFPKLDTIKRKVSTSKSPITRSSCLGVIKQPIRDKSFRKMLQTLSQN